MPAVINRLPHDRRGAILIIAIPMSLIVVGCMWFLVSVGDAVLYRERLQDAADATAFQSAVLHAQGMNALASLNASMHVLLALAAFMRGLCVLAIAGQTLFGGADALLAKTAEVDRQVSPRIEQALKIIAETQRGVATAAPVLASVRASTENTDFYRRERAAEGTLAFSYALLPTRDDAFFTVVPGRPWLLSETQRAHVQPRLADVSLRSSLPLQAATQDVSCSDARGLGAQELWALAPQLLQQRAHSTAARAFAERLHLTPSASAFCASTACDSASAPEAKASCQRALSERPARVLSDRPLEIWTPAQNGNVLLQTWAIAMNGAPEREASNERGMSLATPTTHIDIRAERSAVAQAEYYFACTSSWHTCEADAALHPRWTARMRRFVRPDQHTSALANSLSRALLPRRAAWAERGLTPALYLEAFFAKHSAAFIH